MKFAIFTGIMAFHLAIFARPQAPDAVTKYANRLEKEMTEELHALGHILRRDSYFDVVSLVRNDRSAARSWSLDPNFIPELTDAEIVEFITYSVNHYFICGSYTFSSVSLETMEIYDSPLEALPLLSAPMSCADVIEGLKYITKREEFNYALAKLRMHTVLEGRPLIETQYWLTPNYQGNKKYMMDNYGEGLSIRTGFAKYLQQNQDMEIFDFHLMNLLLLIGLPNNGSTHPRLLFAVPFSH